jgi:hypothetical protein
MGINISKLIRILRGVAHETDLVVLVLKLVDVTTWAEADAARKETTKSDSCIVY